MAKITGMSQAQYVEHLASVHNNNNNHNTKKDIRQQRAEAERASRMMSI
ncbi:MAG TPA: hypothetical protein VKA40_05950 [Nitrososphaera sp.]|nr:hypothetical protein [Nitrososphaera sp.]